MKNENVGKECKNLNYWPYPTSIKKSLLLGPVKHTEVFVKSLTIN